MKVFVYGTLREGQYNYGKYFKGYVLHKEEAYVKGALYTIKGVVYPALIDGEDMILGEILTLSEQVCMQDVDEMEGFYGEGCIENEYNKVQCLIYDKEWNPLTYLSVYKYNLENPKQKHLLGDKIVENDYVAYRKNIEMFVR